MNNTIAFALLTTNVFTAILVAMLYFSLFPLPQSGNVENPVGEEAEEMRAEVDVGTEEALDDIEVARQELKMLWADTGLGSTKDVLAAGNAILEKPLDEQSVEELKAIAKRANGSANVVNFILEEYQEVYRENYQYKFVQEKIRPAHDAYVDISNTVKSIRNRAYFNLGLKAEAAGSLPEAFFYFRDAYRLSSFSCDKGKEICMRYQAEQKMKTILDLDEIDSYVYWR